MRGPLERPVARGVAALLCDRRGAGLVSTTILVVALALGSLAGVRVLRNAVSTRSTCVGDQIVQLGQGAAPCSDDAQGGNPGDQPPAQPAADEGGSDGGGEDDGASAEKEALDELLAIAADIIGLTDAKKCITEGDILACLMTALNFTPGKVFGALFKVIANGNKIRKAVDKLLGIIAARKAKKAEQAAEKADDVPGKPDDGPGKPDDTPEAPANPGAGGTLKVKGEPDPERVRELGVNHEQGGVKDLAEGQGGARYEQATGRRIERSTEDGADFIDPEVGPVSLKGPLVNKKTGETLNITDNMVDGLAKSVVKDVRTNTFTNRVVVDTKGMTQAQRDRLRAAIESELAKNPPPAGGNPKDIVFLE
jgi:hypothetical protein